MMAIAMNAVCGSAGTADVAVVFFCKTPEPCCNDPSLAEAATTRLLKPGPLTLRPKALNPKHQTPLGVDVFSPCRRPGTCASLPSPGGGGSVLSCWDDKNIQASACSLEGCKASKAIGLGIICARTISGSRDGHES